MEIHSVDLTKIPTTVCYHKSVLLVTFFFDIHESIGDWQDVVTVFCLISAQGAFEVKDKRLLLFTAILH